MERKEQMDNLQNIVNNIFCVDIMNKTNDRLHANARKTFSKILVEKRFKIIEIGGYLKKHHSTIIYYMKDVDAMLKHTPTVMDKYKICREVFLEGKALVELIEEEPDEKKYIVSLKDKTEMLILEKNILLEKINKYKRLLEEANKYRRLLDIIKLVDSRTQKGKELFIFKKINQMFNGITDYEQKLE